MNTFQSQIAATAKMVAGRKYSTPHFLPIVTGALGVAIFILDTITAREIAVAVFYVAVVLLSVNFTRRRGVFLVAAACMSLTLSSYLLTRTGEHNAGLINCIISLSAIAATTYLAQRIEKVQSLAQEARAQLAHIARVTTLGELAASIAHELNQPLAAVVVNGNACSRWLAAQPANVDEAIKSVRHIVDDANRASEIITRVRALAKRTLPQKDWLNLNDAILEVAALTRSEIHQNRIILRTRLSDELPLVLGDKIQLQQVMLNLIVNAIDAINAAGSGPREVQISTTKESATGVGVLVGDSGIGLDAAKLHQVFDAFYTTKSEGLGMGLTISRSIIEAHGGRVWATANAPRGAVIQFSLPVNGERS